MTPIIYKPTAKAIKRGALEATDRFIFTKADEAICFNVLTRKVIEPFMRKTVDSHVAIDATASADDLVIPAVVIRMYDAHMTAIDAMAALYNMTIER